eukprot:UC1_evm2s837
MADLAKAIITSLNAEPFNKQLTLVKFDALSPIQLLQILNDVFAAIASDHAMDLRQEDPEDMVVRMLSLLRVLRYKPATPSGFRQGLVAGEPDVVYPILQWCLEGREGLKQRAYLANFLMRIEVPAEMLQSETVAETNTRYLELVEEFQAVHKESEQLRTSGFSTKEIKRDIVHMEEEIAQLNKRIERMRQRFDGVANSGAMLSSARALRLEREREDQLEQQRVDQRNQIMHAEEKLRRAQHLLRDARASALTGGVPELLARMEDDVKGEVYVAEEKLPRAIAEKEEMHREFRRVLNEPSMSEADLDRLRARIADLTSETSALVEKKMNTGGELGDDKLRLFRQQAMLIARKKESTAEKLQDVTEELALHRKEYEEAVTAAGGDAAAAANQPRMLKADEFQVFVAKLRHKNQAFREKKAAMDALRQEYLILDGTLDTLRAQDAALEASAARLEEKHGVTGYGAAQEDLERVSAAKEDLDEQKGRALEDMSAMVDRLQREIDAKQEYLAPVIKELRELRLKYKDVTAEHTQKKASYDSVMAGLDSDRARLDSDMRSIREDIEADEARYHMLSWQIRAMQLQQDRVQQELQRYVGQRKERSMRDIYLERQQEQEVQGRTLRDRQKAAKVSHEPNMRQLDMWRDIQTIMDCKQACMRDAKAEASLAAAAPAGEPNRLVL